MIRIGIIGHGADKFTKISEQKAKKLIDEILLKDKNNTILISGHSPVGGIDIWAEQCAINFDIPMDLKIPKQNKWDAEYGYKQRNLDIAKDSDEIHIILVDKYPPNYNGMKFNICYHCKVTTHIKSGGCWTGIQAKKFGKKVYWHIIKNEQN